MKKIKESQDKEITFYILKSAVQVGINGSMDDLTINLLLDFVKKYYSNLQINQYAEAFELYAAQKLDFKEKPYNNFSTIFVGLILNSYKEYLRKANLKPKAYIPPSQQIENKVNVAEEMEKAYNFIEKVYKEKGEFPIIANWSDAFIYAEVKGLIKLSVNDKQNLKIQVLSIIKSRQLQKRLDTGIKGNSNEFEDGNLKVQCRKRSLINYLQSKTNG